MTSSNSSSHNRQAAPPTMLSPHAYTGMAHNLIPLGGKSHSSLNIPQLPVRTSGKTKINPQQFNSQIFATSGGSSGGQSFASHQFGKQQLSTSHNTNQLNLLYHNDMTTLGDLQKSQNLIATQQFSNPFVSSKLLVSDEGTLELERN